MKFLTATIFLVTFFVTTNALFVWEHIWVGDRVVETHSTRVEVPEGSLLYEVLVKAQSKGHQFSFSYNEGGDPIAVTRFGRHRRDQENNIHWVLFVDDEFPDMNNPPGPDKLSFGGLLQPVADGQHYIFWLKTDNVH